MIVFICILLMVCVVLVNLGDVIVDFMNNIVVGIVVVLLGFFLGVFLYVIV